MHRPPLLSVTLKQASAARASFVFLSSSFTEIFTVMDTSSFVGGGNTVQYFVLVPDRNISESTQRFQSVIPEDSVTFQQAEWAPGLRPGRDTYEFSTPTNLARAL